MPQQVRINERIRVGQVRVIEESGEMLGIMSAAEALAIARDRGLDLIEINPAAQPPVVKILSYDKFRYQQGKALQAQRKRQKKIEVKGIRLSVRIGQHDMAFKAATADKFLTRGDKVKIELMLRGREKANIDFALGVMKKFMAEIKTLYVTEQEPKRLGSFITVVIAPKVNK